MSKFIPLNGITLYSPEMKSEELPLERWKIKFNPTEDIPLFCRSIQAQPIGTARLFSSGEIIGANIRVERTIMNESLRFSFASLEGAFTVEKIDLRSVNVVLENADQQADVAVEGVVEQQSFEIKSVALVDIPPHIDTNTVGDYHDIFVAKREILKEVQKMKRKGSSNNSIRKQVLRKYNINLEGL